MRRVESRTGASLPIVGQGTWEMGERHGERAREVAALQLGFDLGLRLVDTAEMYADGGSEEVVGEALGGRRDDVFVVTKVLPANASRPGTIQAAERSLRRLRTDRIDLYLLHWDGPHPLEETLEAFEELRRAGKILHYGVSNFDVDDMQGAGSLPHGGNIAANQVFYNLARRGIERDLIPWCAHRGIVVMAYSPLDQGRLHRQAALREVALRHGVTAAQVALAWTLRISGVMAIPKAAGAEHVRENAAAAELQLAAQDLRELDAAFPKPDDDVPLESL